METRPVGPTLHDLVDKVTVLAERGVHLFGAVAEFERALLIDCTTRSSRNRMVPIRTATLTTPVHYRLTDTQIE